MRPEGGVGQPKGAIPVTVKPGTAVFFDRRLWHTASPNWSDVTRKVLFYGYGYRWIRTKDDMTVESLWEQSDPVRKQLLGWGVNCNGHYSPTDEDVPLRASGCASTARTTRSKVPAFPQQESVRRKCHRDSGQKHRRTE